jgi:hypothetical protein
VKKSPLVISTSSEIRNVLKCLIQANKLAAHCRNSLRYFMTNFLKRFWGHLTHEDDTFKNGLFVILFIIALLTIVFSGWFSSDFRAIGSLLFLILMGYQNTFFYTLSGLSVDQDDREKVFYKTASWPVYLANHALSIAVLALFFIAVNYVYTLHFLAGAALVFAAISIKRYFDLSRSQTKHQ